VATYLVCCNIISTIAALKLVEIDDDSIIADDQLIQTDTQLDSTNGVRIALKRRQKYLYDYFFPKNMREDIEMKEAKKKSPSLAQ